MNIIVPVTVGYILGAVLAFYFQPGDSQLGYLTLFSLFIIAGLFAMRRQPVALSAAVLLFFLLGMLRTGNAFRPPESPAHISTLITKTAKVTLTGAVTGMPEFDGRATRLEMDIDTVLFHGKDVATRQQIPAYGRIRLSIDSDLHRTVSPGEHLLVMTTLHRTASYQTPGVFDYRLYLADRSIYVTGHIPSPDAIQPYTDLDDPWYTALFTSPERIRHTVATFLETRLEPETAGIYKALLIGSRTGISETTLENFKAAGCMHLLAISGIHMGLLGMMLVLLLTWCMKRSVYLLNRIHVPTAATLLAMPLLFGYAFIAGMNTPVLRALIMSAFFLYGVVLRRQRSIIHIIAAAALLLLMVKPLALFTASFQLSFSAVVAIALLYPRLMQMVGKRPTLPAKVSAYFSAALLVSVAATLGSLPFMLFHFNRFSPIGPIMNLLIEPFLCLWALPVGLVALPFVFISPGFASFLLETGSYGINAAVKLAALGTRIPLASVWSITPDLLEILLYYVILMVWFFNAAVPGKKRTAGIITVVFLLYFTHGLWSNPPGKITEIAYLDVGQGSSTFIRMPMGRTILLDGGNNSATFDAGERIIAPYLWKKKIWRLDDLIISHPHSDHYSGLDFILRRFHPRRLWINGRETDTWPYKNLLLSASRQDIPILTPENADLNFSDGPAVLNGLGRDQTFSQDFPDMAATMSTNDLSLVLRLQHGKYAFLFPGDISARMEEILAQGGEDVEADVLLAPHHGSSGSGSRRFISAVDPEVIIVSAGKNSLGRYPAPDHLREWQRDGRTVLETSRAGTVTLRTDGSNLKVTARVTDTSVPGYIKPR